MSASTVIFYILSGVILGGGWLAVTTPKIFRAAVFLLFSLIGIAGLYFLLDYEFLGAVQIVVYVGGIVVLIIFSIFLTTEAGNDMKKPALLRIIFSAIASIIGCVLFIQILNSYSFKPSLLPAIEPSVKNIGRQMLSTSEHGYILPFEVISILLLAAMIGCIVIAIKIKNPASLISDSSKSEEEKLKSK